MFCLSRSKHIVKDYPGFCSKLCEVFSFTDFEVASMGRASPPELRALLQGDDLTTDGNHRVSGFVQ